MNEQDQTKKSLSTIFSPEIVRHFDERARGRIAFLGSLPKGAHIHICGICGTGTGAVLSLLKQLGYYVTGSDKAFYPPMGDVVKRTADKVYESFSPENLKEKPALVVIGNALSRGNEELEYVLSEKIPFCSMPEVFAAFLIGTKEECETSVVVSGTHGKTTTSSLLASILSEAGRSPGYFIGGVPTGDVLKGSIRPPSKEIEPSQRVVVLEGDEYDSAFFAKYSKFHSYRPDILVILNIEFDHADIFENIEAIESEFRSLILNMPKDGLIVACGDSERLRSFIESIEENNSIPQVIWYGENENSDLRLIKRDTWCYQQIPEKRLGQSLVFKHSGKEIPIKTKLTGTHNALNIGASIIVCERLGLGDERIARGIASYLPMKRRQQIIAEKKDIVLVEDFAHHPTEVRVTLQGLRDAYPEKRMTVVFEPRSNTSRRAFFKEEYLDALSAADCIVLKDIQNAPKGYAGVAEASELLHIPDLVEQLKARGKDAFSAIQTEDLISHIKKNLTRNDLLVVMSNGDFDGIIKSLEGLVKAF